jgi:hypothetical protein
MRVTLTFSCPEEAEEFLEAFHGWQWRRVVQSILEELRTLRKHRDRVMVRIEDVEDLIRLEVNSRELPL